MEIRFHKNNTRLLYAAWYLALKDGGETPWLDLVRFVQYKVPRSVQSEWAFRYAAAVLAQQRHKTRGSQ